MSPAASATPARVSAAAPLIASAGSGSSKRSSGIDPVYAPPLEPPRLAPRVRILRAGGVLAGARERLPAKRVRKGPHGADGRHAGDDAGPGPAQRARWDGADAARAAVP